MIPDIEGPTCHELEYAVIGSMLMEPKIIPEVCEILDDKDYHSPLNSMMHTAIMQVFRKHGTVTAPLVHEALAPDPMYRSAGGPDCIVWLCDAAGVPAMAPTHARRVRDKADLRRISDACARMMYDIKGDPQDSEHKRERLIQELLEIRIHANSEPKRVGELLAESGQNAAAKAKEQNPVPGIPTGIKKLDHLLGGWQPGAYHVIAGRPSMGKTWLAVWSLMAAARAGVPSLLFSIEMSGRSVADRILAAESGHPSEAIRYGRIGTTWINDRTVSEIVAAAAKCQDLPLWVSDDSDMTCERILATTRRMIAKHGVKLVAIDYVQLVAPSGGKDTTREQEVSLISRSIKSLARSLNVAVLALCQLNRQVEYGTNTTYKNSYLRDSGSLEQDADVIAFIHRPSVAARGQVDREQYQVLLDTDPAFAQKCQIHVTKQRNGPVGCIELAADPDRMTFVEYDDAQAV